MVAHPDDVVHVYQINWTGPTTMNDHLFFTHLAPNGTSVNLSDNDNMTGLHFYDFIPNFPVW